MSDEFPENTERFSQPLRGRSWICDLPPDCTVFASARPDRIPKIRGKSEAGRVSVPPLTQGDDRVGTESRVGRIEGGPERKRSGAVGMRSGRPIAQIGGVRRRNGVFLGGGTRNEFGRAFRPRSSPLTLCLPLPLALCCRLHSAVAFHYRAISISALQLLTFPDLT